MQKADEPGGQEKHFRADDLGTMPITLKNSEIIESTLGSWPTFHDAEILSICLDRNGPSISFRILIAQVDRSGARDERGALIVSAHYEVFLEFHDIENLVLQDFGYQNVISALELSETTERRFTSGKVEQRIKVEISSVFGAECVFTCSAGEIVRIAETKLRLGPLWGEFF